MNDHRKKILALTLYGLIGAGTAAQGYVASGDLPKWVGPWIGIPLMGLIAVKAGVRTPPKQEETSK